MGVVHCPETGSLDDPARPGSRRAACAPERASFYLLPLGGAFLLQRAPAPPRDPVLTGNPRGGNAALEGPARPLAALQHIPAPASRPELSGLEEQGLPDIGMSAWSLLLVIVTAMAVLIVVGCLAHVEVTTVADGALRIENGPRPVLAQTSGSLAELSVRAGDSVTRGQLLARLQATELVAERNRRSAELALREHGQMRADETARALRDETVRALEQKRAILNQRIKLKQSTIAAQTRRTAELHEVARLGAGTRTDAMNARATLDAQREELLQLRQQVADLSVQLIELGTTYTAGKLQRDLELLQSEAELSQANALAELTVIEAPVSGRVESLLVSAGQVVTSGSVVARIVPEGDMPLGVVFAPARDAAFLRTGLTASVEFSSLPVSDFGRARAIVIRVASDVAPDAEVGEVMGTARLTEEPLVRVELRFEDDDRWRKMSEHLRSGARLNVRLETQKRRLLSLAFDFLKRWVQ